MDTEHDLLVLLDDLLCVAHKVSVWKAHEMDAMRNLLSCSSYSVINSNSIPHPMAAWNVPARDPAIWKDCVAKGKQAVIISHTHKPGDPACPRTPFIGPNRLCIDSDLVSVETADSLRAICPRFIDAPLQDSSVLLLADTLHQFCLNEQQKLAFTIVAHTIQHHLSDQLRMFLSGMAGIGKSEALKALIYFMVAREESHQLLVLTPTGSSASNVNGSTYHSALCFG